MVTRVTKYILTLTAILFMAACSSDEYVGGEVSKESSISFDGAQGKSTRAGSSPLSQFVNSFVVYGIKTKNNNLPELVFNNYEVQYTENSANTTETNTNGWEYVGVKANQSIKYWDYSADSYKFMAVASADKLSDGFNVVLSDGSASPTITLQSETGLINPTDALYFSKVKVVERENGSEPYSTPVQLEFLAAVSRVRFGFYETIPGYSVKDVKFYDADNATSGSENRCTLNGHFYTEGTVTLNYSLKNNTVETVYNGVSPTSESYCSFGTLNYDTSNSFLGQISSNATYSGTGDGYYTNILPNPTNQTALTLKVDYTLLSNDGSGQEIVVRGATAVVPANYCQWKINYSYTYLFKLTDSALTPITFAAYSEIPNTTDNQQGTITTVGDYSITTYQEGSTDEEGIDYKTGKDMEVTVVQNVGEGSIRNIPLNGTTDYVVIYHQATNKEWVVETTVPDMSSEEKLTKAKIPCAGVYLETVEYTGTENGYDTSGKAHFIPDVTGTYRVEYWHKDNAEAEPVKLAVKIVKIHGEETEIEEYEKWQNGVSDETEW